MRIAIPVFSDDGEKSQVYGHFGSAPCFIIFDTSTAVCENINNSGKEHAHGMCLPLASFEGRNIDAIVTGGMGLRALQKVSEAGLKAYRSSEGMTVSDVARSLQAGTLPEITMEGACSDHSCG